MGHLPEETRVNFCSLKFIDTHVSGKHSQGEKGHSWHDKAPGGGKEEVKDTAQSLGL